MNGARSVTRRSMNAPVTSLRNRACSAPSRLMMESGAGSLGLSFGAPGPTAAARLNRGSASTPRATS